MTSKPSLTNCPNASSAGVKLIVSTVFIWILQCVRLRRLFILSLVRVMSSLISGGYCDGAPPLPIPNREVKPACADGTAMQCGRVGHRLLLSESRIDRKVCPGFFCALLGAGVEEDGREPGGLSEWEEESACGGYGIRWLL